MSPSCYSTSPTVVERAPPNSADEVAAAIAEVHHENTSSMTEATHAGRPNAWLQQGFDGEPTGGLDAYRNGIVIPAGNSIRQEDEDS